MSKNVLYFDPICGMKVDPAEHGDSSHTLEYNGKDYYFCSPFCTAVFLEDPERYAHDSYEISDENENTEIEN